MGNILCCEAFVATTAKQTGTPIQIIHPPNKGRASIVSTASKAFRNSANKIITCTHDFKEAHSGKRFRKGDALEIYGDTDDEWFTVLNLSTKVIGCIPRNYTNERSTNESQDWFVGMITRREAERILLNQEYLVTGLFLVRNVENKQDCYVLSTLHFDDDKDFYVIHYKILAHQNGFSIYSEIYSNLSDIVQAYQRQNKISIPCPKPEPPLWDLDLAHKRNWELSRDDIELGHDLGDGKFGKVQLGFWKNSTPVAVKILKDTSISKDKLLQEASIMKKFRHPGLLALYGVCSDDEPIYLVLEYMKNGDLLTFLRKDHGSKLKTLDLVDMAAQISSGMEHLELKNLVHRDLAARNVLVGESNIIKISDFGMARLLSDSKYEEKKDYFIPLKWTAPESIVSLKFTTKSDIWSYGILLMELFTYGEVPYKGIKPREVITKVRNGYRMEKPPDLSDDIYEVMLQCWQETPAERATFTFLTNFFKELLNLEESYDTE